MSLREGRVNPALITFVIPRDGKVRPASEGAPMKSFNAATQAARQGRVGEVRHLLDQFPELVTCRDPTGETLLGLACRAATGDVALPPVPGTPEQHAAIDLILSAGADPSAANHDGWAPLHTAAMTGHVDLIQRLLAAGASPVGRLLGCDGGSPLALALFYAQAEAAQLLADPPIPYNLRTAASLGHCLGLFFSGDKLLPTAVEGLDFYRPIREFPEWQRTLSRQEVLDEALSWAARNNQCEAMAQLVERGANVNANPFRGTPLLWAVNTDKLEAATWLLDHGADPDLRHDFGGRHHGQGAVAMHLAAQHGSVRCLELLLARGADPLIKDEAYGGTPLGWANHVQCKETIRILEAHV